MAVEPGAHLGVLVSGVVVEDDVNGLAGRHSGVDRVEEPCQACRLPIRDSSGYQFARYEHRRPDSRHRADAFPRRLQRL